jgi:hypothetical protein
MARHKDDHPTVAAKKRGKVRKMEGGAARQRLDRPRRKSGGSSGDWMEGAVKHPGALHRELGVPAGQKIPAKKLEKAEHSSNPLERKRADLAETFKKERGS